MKVAFIVDQYPPHVRTGAGTHAYGITRALARLGVEIHVIAPHAPGCALDETVDGVSVHRVTAVGKRPLKTISYRIGVRRGLDKLWQRAGGFDVIHVNGARNSLPGGKRIGGVPRIVTVHQSLEEARARTPRRLPPRNLLLRHVGRWLSRAESLIPYFERKNLRQADRIIAVSEDTKRRLLSSEGIPPDQVEVIHNGYEEQRFSFSQQEKAQVREQYSLPTCAPIVLFVGRLDDDLKGFASLLNAFASVSKVRRALLVAVGSGNQTQWKQQAAALGVAENCVFTGFVDDRLTLAKLYSICDVYVCPSLLEPFGLVVVDAMAARKPVVATKIGGIPEIVQDGYTGLLVEPGDEHALASAIIHLLTDTAVAKRMGEAGRGRADSVFTWDAAAHRTLQMYKSLTEASSDVLRPKRRRVTEANEYRNENRQALGGPSSERTP
jgi:glycosyltransferase involved in cell wall biosynthesis